MRDWSKMVSRLKMDFALIMFILIIMLVPAVSARLPVEGDEMTYNSPDGTATTLRYSDGVWNTVGEGGALTPFAQEGFRTTITSPDGGSSTYQYTNGEWISGPEDTTRDPAAAAAIMSMGSPQEVMNAMFDYGSEFSADPSEMVSAYGSAADAFEVSAAPDQPTGAVPDGGEGAEPSTTPAGPAGGEAEGAPTIDPALSAVLIEHNMATADELSIMTPQEAESLAQTLLEQVHPTGGEHDELIEQALAAGIPIAQLIATDTDAEWAALRTEVRQRNAAMRTLAGEFTAGELAAMSTNQLRTYAARRQRYTSITGNPNEWYSACAEATCGPMEIEIELETGNIYAAFDREGEERDRVELPYDCPTCTVTNLQSGGDEDAPLTSCTDGVCSAEVMFAEGMTVVDRNTGQGYDAQGVEYRGVDTEGNPQTYDTREACEEAGSRGCSVRPKPLKAEHYYWAPTSWTDFFRGGPATQAYRSLSSIISPYVDWPAMEKWRGWLDRYFSLEQWTTIDACSVGPASPHGGVGYSPYGGTIPTATIQAQRFMVTPCLDLEGAARTRCLENRSLNTSQDYYFIYRVTGRVIPRDCGMKFNIYLDSQPLYGSERIAEQGAPVFDLSGANAIVTAPTGAEYSTVCIKFSDEGAMRACIRTRGTWGSPEVCNKVYESGDPAVTQKAVEDDSAGGGATMSAEEGGPETSSNREGCTLC
jgi:hypothetical protein